jgi:DNA invertase Pin-like site-specific DNA recombinase
MIVGDGVVGYLRVSTEDQGRIGYGLDAQRAAIEKECGHRGLRLLGVEQDVASGATTKRRPGLDRAVRMCERGEAQGVIAAKLDRMSRSVADFADLLTRARKGEWNVIVLDLGVDLASPVGEALANIAATMAQWERRIISDRTKAALAEAQKQGKVLGRPMVMKPATRRRIQKLRDKGMSYETIASYLTERGITTDGGASWYPTTVRRACVSGD